MGLDMYLTRRVYVGAEYGRVTGKIELEKDGKPIPVNLGKVDSIIESVAYWRKANAIHDWFVNNIQDGDDDCREYYVTREKLEELYETCDKTLKYLDMCDTVQGDPTIYLVDEEHIELPTTTGPFFGSDEYNEYYKEQLEDTIKILGSILKEEDEYEYSGDYYYQSSW